MTSPVGLTPAYIYPLHKAYQADVLNFFLYPDSGEISLGSGGGSAPHPSYGHSIKQLTGRLSPTFSFSLMFEGISPPRPVSTKVSGLEAPMMSDDSRNAYWQETARYEQGGGRIAQSAFEWFMRNVGPDDRRQLRDEAQLFVLRLWGGGSRVVSIDKARLQPMITSRSRDSENLIRRFRVDISGEYVYPVSVDPRLFKKPARRRAGGGKLFPNRIKLNTLGATKDHNGNYTLPKDVRTSGGERPRLASSGAHINGVIRLEPDTFSRNKQFVVAPPTLIDSTTTYMNVPGDSFSPNKQFMTLPEDSFSDGKQFIDADPDEFSPNKQFMVVAPDTFSPGKSFFSLPDDTIQGFLPPAGAGIGPSNRQGGTVAPGSPGGFGGVGTWNTNWADPEHNTAPSQDVALTATMIGR